MWADVLREENGPWVNRQGAAKVTSGECYGERSEKEQETEGKGPALLKGVWSGEASLRPPMSEQLKEGLTWIELSQ